MNPKKDIPRTRSNITVVSNDCEVDSMASFYDAKPPNSPQITRMIEETPERVQSQRPKGERASMTSLSGSEQLRLTRRISCYSCVAVKQVPNDQTDSLRMAKSRQHHRTEAERGHVRETILRIGGNLVDPTTNLWVTVKADPKRKIKPPTPNQSDEHS